MRTSGLCRSASGRFALPSRTRLSVRDATVTVDRPPTVTRFGGDRPTLTRIGGGSWSVGASP
jgi:hypothetical protein